MRTWIAALNALCLVLPAQGAFAQEASQAQVDELARDLSRVQSVRAVKDLQRAYVQYAQFGLWDEMATLFARDATIVWGDKTVSGPNAIGDWLKTRVGGARGLAPGALHLEMIDSELVNLSVDGASAKSRFEALTFHGDGKGGTWIDGGTYEDQFVFEDGAWKFARVQYFPQLEGDYAHGWANAGGGDLPRTPYHFTVADTGIPIPAPVGPAAASNTTLGALEERIEKLNYEDDVRNLQNAFGYYLDRQMWTDVVDLFSEDSAIEIVGKGTFKGKAGIRQALETMGKEGLDHGELSEHPLFSVMVEVQPGHTEALSRGIDLGLVGDADAGTSSWNFNVFRNRFVREYGLWKIKEMRLYPLLVADYADGWSSLSNKRPAQGMLPAFIRPNPVTGKAVTLAGAKLTGEDRLTAAPAPQAQPAAAQVPAGRLAEAKRRLMRSAAYDAVENVGHAYGYYLTDAYWTELGQIFADKGNKLSPFAGYYLGKDRISAAATAMYGTPDMTKLRPSIPYHWRTQPVVLVSHDGRSASIRTRLFQPGTSRPKAGNVVGGGLAGGMYQDQMVLDKDGWKVWTLTIDEHYWNMAGWKGGWSAAKDPPPGQAAGQSPLVARLKPDILLEELGRREEHFRGGTGQTLQWPQQINMWFGYRNLVTGRFPEFYWPDGVPSLLLPQSRLIANGYQQPPAGPQVDGIHVELPLPDAMVMEGK